MLFTHAALNHFAKDPAVVRFHDRYYLYFSQRYNDYRFGIGIAVSDDLDNWTVCGEVPLEMPYEQHGIAAPGTIVLDGCVHLFYQSYGNGQRDAICHAFSADGLHFAKNPENPVYAPKATWCIGRAIDADLCVFHGRLHLYFATRDHDMRVQKLGGAWADLNSGFGRDAWTALADQSLLTPELKWEGECIEAPATVVVDGKIYLFYGGSYNCKPQQIGCAVSEDGVFFRRVSSEPILPCGPAGAWNSSESGHPYVFQDDDGRIHLFYQGSADMGETWYLSRKEVVFENGLPRCID